MIVSCLGYEVRWLSNMRDTSMDRNRARYGSDSMTAGSPVNYASQALRVALIVMLELRAYQRCRSHTEAP